MNVDEHIEENIKVAKLTKPQSMSEEEIGIVNDVKLIYKELMKVPCTGCNYCMPCPFNVDIPGTFTDYNNKYFFSDRQSQFQYIGKTVGMMGTKKSGADLCTDCGKCEKHCPQEIEIRKELKVAHKNLDNWFIKQALKVVVLFMGGRKKKEQKV